MLIESEFTIEIGFLHRPLQSERENRISQARQWNRFEGVFKQEECQLTRNSPVREKDIIGRMIDWLRGHIPARRM